jgi:hypothetical protein
VIEAIAQVPGQIEIIIIPPVNEFRRGIGKLNHSSSDVAEGTCGRCLIDNPHARMVEMKCNWVLIVDQQRSVREGGLLQKTSQCLADELMASAGSHEAIYLDHVQNFASRFYGKSLCLLPQGLSMTAF